jgi:hypothetical protein
MARSHSFLLPLVALCACLSLAHARMSLLQATPGAAAQLPAPMTPPGGAANATMPQEVEAAEPAEPAEGGAKRLLLQAAEAQAQPIAGAAGANATNTTMGAEQPPQQPPQGAAAGAEQSLQQPQQPAPATGGAKRMLLQAADPQAQPQPAADAKGANATMPVASNMTMPGAQQPQGAAAGAEQPPQQPPQQPQQPQGGAAEQPQQPAPAEGGAKRLLLQAAAAEAQPTAGAAGANATNTTMGAEQPPQQPPQGAAAGAEQPLEQPLQQPALAAGGAKRMLLQAAEPQAQPQPAADAMGANATMPGACNMTMAGAQQQPQQPQGAAAGAEQPPQQPAPAEAGGAKRLLLQAMGGGLGAATRQQQVGNVTERAKNATGLGHGSPAGGAAMQPSP